MIKLKMGMVGGGPSAFIGEIHRMAARLDNKIELICGAFSSNPEKSVEFGLTLGLNPDRCYPDYETMIEKERDLPQNERMDFLAIVTPNNVHFEPARLALKNGFHVLSDKPATLKSDETKELVNLVNETNLIYGLTHNYTGYPMVKEAKWMVKQGKLGDIRKVVAEYPQGWLSTKLEDCEHKQASWRTDPARAGLGGSLTDIGTHAENLAEYITGLKISELCADVSSLVEGRLLDDDTNVLVRFENGARGIIYCSQISLGEENAMAIRIYGTKASLEWHQMEPNTLTVKFLDKPMQLLRTGQGYLSKKALDAGRIPPGHPEGFIEGFANIYKEFARAVSDFKSEKYQGHEQYDFPNVNDALRGMQFIETVIESSKSEKKWITFQSNHKLN